MKKLLLLTFACFTLSNVSLLAQKKVAVTTFWVSKHIGFEEIGGGPALVAAISSLSEDPDFNLQPVLDNFYRTFTEEYSKEFPFELMSEEEVLTREEYVNYEGRFNEDKDADRNKLFQRYLTPEGYKPMQVSLFKGEKSNQMQMVSVFNDADGVMFVSMGYDFVKKPLPFTAGIRAYVEITLWNNEGKRVFYIRELGTSKKTVAIVGGIPVMKSEKLLPLCESASEKLLKDLNKKIKKMTRKAAKKL